MLAAKLYGPQDLRLEETARPARPPGGVLIRVEACGLCASDLKMWRRGHKELVLPRVLGHEIAGRVLEADPDCGLRPGQRVQVFPGIACGTCPACRQGMHQRCPRVEVLGFSRDGGLATHLALPAASLALGGVNPLPLEMEPALATLAEPLACALNALEAARLAPGERVVIFGAGVMGRLTALAAQALGAGPTLILEVDPQRLEGGVAPVLDVSPGFAPAEVWECLGGPAQVVVPACRDPRAVDQGLELLAPGGRLVLFSGLEEGRRELDLNRLHYRELSLCGAYGCNAGQNRRALEVLARHREAARGLIAHRLPLHRVQEAFALAAAGPPGKVVIHP